MPSLNSKFKTFGMFPFLKLTWPDFYYHQMKTNLQGSSLNAGSNKALLLTQVSKYTHKKLC